MTQTKEQAQNSASLKNWKPLQISKYQLKLAKNCNLSLKEMLSGERRTSSAGRN